MLDGKKTNISVGGDYDPIPSDKYTVQIADVNLVTQFNKWKGEDQELLNYQYTVLDEKPMPESDESTRGRLLWHRMSQSLSSKSWLFKMVRAVYGRDLTREELEAFAEDPECIIGRQVDVMVEQNPSNDGATIYNNIISYSKCVKKLEPYMEVQATKTLEKETSPLGKNVDLDNALPVPEGTLDFEDAFSEKEEGDLDNPTPTKAKVKPKSDTGDKELDEILDSDPEEDLEDDEDVAVAEAELKLKKAKAKAAKAKKAKE